MSTGMTAAPPRVMWLLNHAAARAFEVTMLKRLGIREIFLPKSYPADPGWRSGSVDWSEDANLTIPADDLQVLNAADWYAGATPEAWRIANRHFDILFFMANAPEGLRQLARNFQGAILWRAYGLEAPRTYGELATVFSVLPDLLRMPRRFHFAEAYAHLADQEPEVLQARRCFLPLGLLDSALRDGWEGGDRHIYFVCPSIGSTLYYQQIYRDFLRHFGDLPYVVAGAQHVPVDDPRVLGFVSAEEHARNMAQARVMFYHSVEPNHLHYHPWEAVRAGMPLVFMAGGVLDRLGGRGLPGRCTSFAEARRKLKRILDGDQALIGRIRASQHVLLAAAEMDRCEPAWRQGLTKVMSELADLRAEQQHRPPSVRRKRIAVILPQPYRGGTLRGAMLLAEALHLGSRQCDEPADIVLVHQEDAQTEDLLADLPAGVSRRTMRWKTLPARQAQLAMRYAGFVDWEAAVHEYFIPDDGIRQLQDCDLWLCISDRLPGRLLPLKPVVLMVYDYLQRYEQGIVSPDYEMHRLVAARTADRVLVTTEFTRRDAAQYAGVSPACLIRVPMLTPAFPALDAGLGSPAQDRPCFIWTTNAGPHKNHVLAAQALRIYYEELGGQLECRVTGVDSQGLLVDQRPHLVAMAEIFRASRALSERVVWCGELPDAQYRSLLARAVFLWHPARLDNGTFCVVEAACLGVPALSSDYPAMREIDAGFGLGLAWMDPADPRNMAEQLKWMEVVALTRRDHLPAVALRVARNMEISAREYWQGIRPCL